MCLKSYDSSHCVDTKFCVTTIHSEINAKIITILFQNIFYRSLIQLSSVNIILIFVRSDHGGGGQNGTLLLYEGYFFKVRLVVKSKPQ